MNDPEVDARLSPSQPAYPRFVAKDPNPYAISMNAPVCTVHVPLAQQVKIIAPRCSAARGSRPLRPRGRPRYRGRVTSDGLC